MNGASESVMRPDARMPEAMDRGLLAQAVNRSEARGRMPCTKCGLELPDIELVSGYCDFEEKPFTYVWHRPLCQACVNGMDRIGLERYVTGREASRA